MKTFITEDFLLQNEFAKRLYHEHVKNLPIIDYHNHLPPQNIATNHIFENITQVWLAGDHYKWRAMRALGVEEQFITGSASDKEKFIKWAESVPYTVRNPLYHWTHLELKRYFQIDELLSAENAGEVYDKTSAMLREDSHSTIGLLKQQQVQTLCTTDDPIDTLEYHTSIGKNPMGIKVLPAFRPDKAYAVENTEAYISYLENLEEASNLSITSYNDLLQALENRIDYFHTHGGRLADHGLEQLYLFDESAQNIDSIFRKLKDSKALNTQEIRYYKMKTLLFLGRCYHKKGWVQQFHLGALRNNNARLLGALGPDTGFDSIGNFSQAQALSKFLDILDSADELPKTILYNLNSGDNEVMATMAGNFNDGSTRGKVQYGSAWWYHDQKEGMEDQLNTLSNLGILSTFIGMLTDSRSFLSFPRHEYFRRVLCNLIGKDVHNGELPSDEKWLGKIAADVCYHNAKNYFDF